MQHLVEVTRKRAGRNPNPTYAIIDSQSVKTVYASEQIGFDGGKKQNRKRHIVTDVLGNLRYPTIQKYCGDKGYRKTFVFRLKTILGLDTDLSEKIVPKDLQ